MTALTAFLKSGEQIEFTPRAERTPQPVKRIVGGFEAVELPEIGLTFTAKIDTGAVLSSLHGTNFEFSHEYGVEMISFDTIDPHDGAPVHVKLPLAGYKKTANAMGIQKRPVVQLMIRLAGKHIAADFTLADRSHLTTPVLIGQQVLSGRMTVDVDAQFLHGTVEE